MGETADTNRNDGNQADDDRRPSKWRWLRVPRWPLAGAAVLAGLGAALAWEGLHTAWGTRALLSLAPVQSVVQVEGASGSLWGAFAARRVGIAVGGQRFVLEDLAWQGARLTWAPSASTGSRWGIGVSVDRLQVARAAWLAKPSAQAQQAPSLPQSLALPLSVRVQEMQLGQLALPALSSTLGERPLRDLRLTLQLNAPVHGSGGPAHMLQIQHLAWDQIELSGAAHVALRSPFMVQAQMQAAGRGAAEGGAQPVSLKADASGALNGLDLSAQITSGAQQLQARAHVQPFAAWPLDLLQAQAQALDLAALDTRAPTTALSGVLTVQPRAGATAWRISADLRNTAAGPWHERRVPVLSLKGQADVGNAAGGVARIDLPEAWLGLGLSAVAPAKAATAARAQARDPDTAAGRIKLRATVQGQWAALSAADWDLHLGLEDVRPAVLDARAPALVLGGPLQWRGVAPWAALQQWLEPGEGHAARSNLKADLLGRSDAGPALAGAPSWTARLRNSAAALRADVELSGRALRVDHLQASLGPSQAQGRLELARERAATRLSGALHLAGFDPIFWWPGLAQAQVAGTTQVNAQLQLDVRLPDADAASAGDWRRRLAQTTGQAELQIGDSRLAGVPLAGTLKLGAPAAAPEISVAADLSAAGNHLAGQLRLQRAQEGSGAWTVNTDAPDLERLSAAAQLLGAPALRGQLRMQGQGSGMWPRFDGALDAQASKLMVGAAGSGGGLEVEQGRARLCMGACAANAMGASRGPSPGLKQGQLQGLLDIQHARWAGWRVDQAHAELSGSLAQHSIKLHAAVQPPQPEGAAAAPVKPPVGGDVAAANQASARKRRSLPPFLVDAAAGGGFMAEAAGPDWSWRGRIQSLRVVPVEDAAATALARLPWLDLAQADLVVARRDGLLNLDLSPMLISSLGAKLRVQRLHWHPGGDRAGDVDVQAELEPLAIAPLMQLLQPEMGWGGDLAVAGSLRWRHEGSAGVVLQAELARRSGDLTQTESALEGGSITRLNLTALRVAAVAQGGRWTFTQEAAGRNLGTVQGQQVVQADAHDLWPQPDAGLQGQVDLKIANLRPWASWVPAGWRLGGQVQARAVLGGRLNAPEYTGTLEAHQVSVRNVLEGVDVRDGEILVALQGPQAVIRRFTARAGDGELSVEGQAAFADPPHAHLRVTAKRFALLQRVDRRAVVSGQVDVDLPADAVDVRGRIDLDEGLIDITRGDAPGVGDDVSVDLGDDDDDAQAQAKAKAATRHLSLNLQIGLGDKLKLRGHGLDATLGGDVHLASVVSGGGSKLSADGTVRVVSGTYAAYGQKLNIDRGAIRFVGPLDNPRLDIQASRQRSSFSGAGASNAALPGAASGDEVNVGVMITGTAQSPRVRLFSEPEMSDTEKLSWLVLGRGSSGLGRPDVAVLQSAAAALLAGDADDKSNWVESIGLDDLSVRQSDGDVHETIVSLGKQLSRRWYVGYERSLSATAGTWQLVYRAAQRFTVRAQTGLDHSLDLIWSWRWR